MTQRQAVTSYGPTDSTHAGALPGGGPSREALEGFAQAFAEGLRNAHPGYDFIVTVIDDDELEPATSR